MALPIYKPPPLEGMTHLRRRVIVCEHSSKPNANPFTGHDEGLKEFVERLTAVLGRQKDLGSPRRIQAIRLNITTPFYVEGFGCFVFSWKATLESCPKEQADCYLKVASCAIMAPNAVSAATLSVPPANKGIEKMTEELRWLVPRPLPPIFIGLTTDLPHNLYVKNCFMTAPLRWLMVEK